MWNGNLYDPEIRGNALYFFTEKCGNESQKDKIGQMRIRFYYYPCKEATIVARQTLTDEGEYTFDSFELD